MKNYCIPVILFLQLLICSICLAQLRLPAIISSGMVLQQNDSVALWGWANPGEKLFVTTGWDNKTDSTIITNGAAWKLKVKTPAAGGPYTITIKNRTVITLNNVMIGEVWICSGQSNMQYSYNSGVKDIAAEFDSCYNNNLRFFHIPKATSAWPQEDVKAQWSICDSNTLKNFSAVAYFFGKKLQHKLHTPIGLINASWGGTPAETWAPQEIINNDPQLKEAAAQLKPSPSWSAYPGFTYNAMIAPLTSFSIAGAIWYQGETNVLANNTYNKLLTAMIDAWRQVWKKDFPFYYVQIAPFKYNNNNVGALLQEAQTKSMNHAGVGMVVINDLIDSVTNIHPSYKHEVGYRLANWALAQTYHQPGIVYKSPMFKSAEKKNDKLILSFDNVNTELLAKNKTITGFYISGEKEEWYPAEVKIAKDKIIVGNKNVKDPAFVRYGFGNTIIGNLFSAEGLPLCPFRTDNWMVDQSPMK